MSHAPPCGPRIATFRSVPFPASMFFFSRASAVVEVAISSGSGRFCCKSREIGGGEATFFRKETRTQVLLVPYRGNAPAVQDLAAGEVDLFLGTSNELPLMRAGRIKAYAQPAFQGWRSLEGRHQYRDGISRPAGAKGISGVAARPAGLPSSYRPLSHLLPEPDDQ
jgi:Tripartite tricarboxylate transporter family receptor